VAKTQALSRPRKKRAVRFLECALAAHYGIDPRTKQNHNGNVVPFRAAHTGAASATSIAMLVCATRGSR